MALCDCEKRKRTHRRYCSCSKPFTIALHMLAETALWVEFKPLVERLHSFQFVSPGCDMPDGLPRHVLKQPGPIERIT